MNVALFGATDRELEDLLKAGGATVRQLGERELTHIGDLGGRVPDVLVLDLRDLNALPPGMADVKRRHPAMGVVVVARPDPVLMLEAMRAGITEWITDVRHDELQAAIERVAEKKSHAAAPGKVYAFLGAKGGVGTTTIVVNVASALNKLTNASTLVIDLHIAHGDAAVFMGTEPRFSIVDAIQNPQRLDKAFFRSLVTKTKAGPDLLASSDRSIIGPIDSRGIAAIIEFASRQYEHVLLDVPRSDSTVLDALDAVSRFTIVANQELATVRSASRLAATLRQRYGREKVGVVVSRYDKTADIAREDMSKAVGSAITHIFPSDYRLALEALNTGRPMVLENHTRLAASYVDFARSIGGVARPVPEEKSGLFDIFGKRR
jgi:pilus assembly protein CpaE